ncbi:hypothetical protein [uncultured Croceitalea sp.]|uniref:hypothetical protein n=1 Tax=uncultured Croceitalea sp. TaxID=1798908 RepID=UPI00330621C6
MKKTLQKYYWNLKEFAKIVNNQKSISSYVACHSFANRLKQKGIPIYIISKSLGHKNLAIAQV